MDKVSNFNEEHINQFKKEMNESFTESDFSTFISQNDARKYAEHMNDEYFKSLLTMKSIHEYKINESKQALSEGGYAGASPEDLGKRDIPEESSFVTKHENIVENSTEMVRFYEREIDKIANNQEKGYVIENQGESRRLSLAEKLSEIKPLVDTQAGRPSSRDSKNRVGLE